MAGTTQRHTKKKMTAKATMPAISSDVSGSSNPMPPLLWVSSSAARIRGAAPIAYLMSGAFIIR